MAVNHSYDVNTTNRTGKGVGEPTARYESLAPIWKRIRAVLGGQETAKQFDRTIRAGGTAAGNLLIPFNPTMTGQQYAFYRQEAELPGIVSQFARTVIGGMLRKEATLGFPDEVPDEAEYWIRNRFTSDNKGLISFLADALWEELNTSRAWVCVNYPDAPEGAVSPGDGGPPETFPILLAGESIINWATGVHPQTGETTLTRAIVRMYVQEPDPDNEFHDNWIDRVWVHDLDEQGFYRIRIYEKGDPTGTTTGVVAGQLQQDYTQTGETGFVEVLREENIMRAGERLTFIPFFPLNGNYEPMQPMMEAFVDREVGLYNKTSRRNHLLYGASTYTPVLKSNLSDDERASIVGSGLGSWLFLDRDDQVEVLSTPSEALNNFEESIRGTIDEMARMGMRMLSEETAESGVALEIRNAGQTAQLSALARAVSQQLKHIIAFMVNWRYDLDIPVSEFEVNLSTDLSPVPLGDEYLRLVSEWYQAGLIPRSVFLEVLKVNDVLPADYDDDDAMEEINADEMVVNPREQFEMEQAAMQAAAAGEGTNTPGVSDDPASA